MDLPWLKPLFDELSRIEGYLDTLVHPNLVLAHVLDDSVGLLLDLWFKFLLSTTDIESGGDFIANSTIQRFEPSVQVVANAAMVLIALWASYRVMWGQGVSTQYSARVLLPRLVMGAVLINFAMPMFQMAVAANNAICSTIQMFAVHDDLTTFAAEYSHNANAATWEIVTTAALAGGYGVLAIAYLVRYAVLIVLAITAPLAAVFFMLPETQHFAKLWSSHFTTNLFMQPAQLFVLSVGMALEHDGITPVHHLFALASLLIVFKVPGALGGAEKAAHKLESSVGAAFKHIGHALVKA